MYSERLKDIMSNLVLRAYAGSNWAKRGESSRIHESTTNPHVFQQVTFSMIKGCDGMWNVFATEHHRTVVNSGVAMNSKKLLIAVCAGIVSSTMSQSTTAHVHM